MMLVVTANLSAAECGEALRNCKEEVIVAENLSQAASRLEDDHLP